MDRLGTYINRRVIRGPGCRPKTSSESIRARCAARPRVLPTKVSRSLPLWSRLTATRMAYVICIVTREERLQNEKSNKSMDGDGGSLSSAGDVAGGRGGRDLGSAVERGQDAQ